MADRPAACPTCGKTWGVALSHRKPHDCQDPWHTGAVTMIRASDVFESDHPVYVQALQTLCEVAMDDNRYTEEEREKAQERAFGVCVGVATMLLPFVYDHKEVPDPDVADRVCEQVMADMQDKIKKEYLDG